MSVSSTFTAASDLSRSPLTARRVFAAARFAALAGVVAPLVLIGVLKFTELEIEALEPLIGGTPWLAWLYPVFGAAGTSYLLGVFELVTAALFLASPWSPRAGIAGGALGALMFATTSSMLLALPIWEPTLGGFPYLNFAGSFLIKDISLLASSLLVLSEALGRRGA